MQTLQNQLDKKAESVWQDFCLLYPRLIRYNPPKIVLNNRFTKTAGYCVMEDNTVYLGTRFFSNNALTMFGVILPHELAHQVDFIFNGYADRLHHGKTWKAIMLNYGLPADAYHTMEI